MISPTIDDLFDSMPEIQWSGEQGDRTYCPKVVALVEVKENRRLSATPGGLSFVGYLLGKISVGKTSKWGDHFDEDALVFSHERADDGSASPIAYRTTLMNGRDHFQFYKKSDLAGYEILREY